MKALAFLVVAVLLAACGGRSAADSPPAPVPVGLEMTCPEPTTELRFPGGNLPEGATQVRLCAGAPLTDFNGDPIGGSIEAPADLLTTDVGDLVALVNSQRGIERDAMCNADAGPELVYWFGYPDGDWRAVQLGSYGCNLLTVGEDMRRGGGSELASAFTDLLVSQRDEQVTPTGGGVVSCPAWPGVNPHSGLVLPGVELSVATWCISPRAPRVREADIPPDLTRRLNDELWPGLPTRSHPCGEAVSSWIEALTPWGDAVAFAIDSCGEIHPLHGAWVLDDGERHYITPELEAALISLPLGPLVDSTAPACPAWDADPTYAGGDLPPGPVSLRVCSGEGPQADAFAPVGVPGEALTTGVDELASLVNELPAWEPPDERSFCSQGYRPAINFLFGYPDGSARSVTWSYGECGLLEVGPPGDFPDETTLAKSDPQPFFDAVNAAVLAQRSTTTPPSQRSPGATCEPSAWPMTLLPATGLDLGSASLCVGNGSRQIPVPPKLLDRLAVVLATATPAEEAPPCEGSRTARVVGISTWGDPIEVHVGPCQSVILSYTPGIETWAFELPAALADDLFALASTTD